MSVWQQYPAQVFDLSLPQDSPVTSIQELAGSRLSVPVLGVKRIVEPLLLEAGVDPASVTLVENGADWNLLVAQKKADAGLAWEGLRAQLMGQGLKLKYILGSSFSEGPSNAYVVRQSDLKDDERRDALVRFLEAVVMGLEFARSNPRAAAQITYRAVPGLADRLRPQVAVNALVQIANGHAVEEERGNGWGFHNEASWRAYLETIAGLGQTTKRLEPEDVLTNDFVERANAGADVERARNEAQDFDLDDDFAQTNPPERGIAMPLADLAERRVFYVEEGDGAPLLLLGDLGADHTMWSDQLERFKQQFRVIAFDNPGSGRTTGPPGPYSTELFADVAAELLGRVDH